MICMLYNGVQLFISLIHTMHACMATRSVDTIHIYYVYIASTAAGYIIVLYICVCVYIYATENFGTQHACPYMIRPLLSSVYAPDIYPALGYL